MEIGESLKKYRNTQGLTQEQLAKTLNVTRQTISKWENNKSFPDIENLIWLCDIYGISLDELVGRSQITYETATLKKKNKRKVLLYVFPKYFGRVALALCVVLLFFMVKGQLTTQKENNELKEAGYMQVYSVDDVISDASGNYDYFQLENGEQIDATRANIKKYQLEDSVNKVKTQLTDRSSIFVIIEEKLLKE